jgi:hypothetical protein
MCTRGNDAGGLRKAVRVVAALIVYTDFSD